MVTTKTTQGSVHPFERAGMGSGPYRFAGAYELPSRELAAANPDAYNAALRDLPRLTDGNGSCSCCGMPITNIFVVRNAAGQLYGVGCECVDKLYGRVAQRSRRLSADELDLARAFDRARREHNRHVRHAREDRRLGELRGFLANDIVKAKLAQLPHPRGRAGETAADHVAWIMHNAGTTGQLALLKWIRAHVLPVC